MNTPPLTQHAAEGDRSDTAANEPFPLMLHRFGLVLLVCGAVGFAAAAVLTVEKFLLLTNPSYTPTCSINATFSCGSVMTSPQAELFGFPNSFLGIAGFAVVATTGAALLAGARLAGWYWAGMQVGVTAAVVFVHWLMIQSVLVIGALCPYCMVVWAATIPTFWYVTLHNLAWRQRRTASPGRGVSGFVLRQHAALLAIWLLALTAVVAVTTWLG